MFTSIRAGATAVAIGAAGGTGDGACVTGAGNQPAPHPYRNLVQSNMTTVPSVSPEDAEALKQLNELLKPSGSNAKQD